MFAFVLYSAYTTCCFMAKKSRMTQRNKQARQTFHCFLLNSHFIQPSEWKYVLFVCLSVCQTASIFYSLAFQIFWPQNFFPHSWYIEGKTSCAIHSTIFMKKDAKLFFTDVVDCENKSWCFLDKTVKIWQRENIALYGIKSYMNQNRFVVLSSIMTEGGDTLILPFISKRGNL